jgi:hypothetical protein
MNNFPVKFFAHHVQTDVEQNRMKKIEQELKIIRNKIVDSFQSSVSYHSEVQHDLLPDLTEDEKKSFYCTIKDELSKRGFTVRGKCTNGQLSLIIFSNAPRTVEMDRILKQYVDQSGRRSRSSSVGGQIKQENTPVLTKELSRSSITITERKQSESNVTPETREAKPRSNSLKGQNISSTFKSKIPIIQSKQQSTSVPTTPSSSGISASISAPSTPLSTMYSKTANPKSEKNMDNMSTHSESDESFNNEITMEFIMNKLKKANDKKQNKNKEHV